MSISALPDLQSYTDPDAELYLTNWSSAKQPSIARMQDEHRSFPSLLSPKQHYYLLQCVWKRNTVPLPPRPFAILNRIGSGTCDRETPFLFTPPFHLTIKKLYTPHQQQHYIYYLLRENLVMNMSNDSRKRSLTLSPGLGCDGLHLERRCIRHVDTGQLS